MPRIRILIVEDSVVMRRLIADALSEDPDLEVVGTAADGRIALAKIPQVNPDIVTLDVEMPVLDGLATLKELRKVYSHLPVIMFSTMTERAAAATLDALALGANDYVTKPSKVAGAREAIEKVQRDLIPKIKVFCRSTLAPLLPVPRPTRVAGAESPKSRAQLFEVLVVGASTGGPNALATFAAGLGGHFSLPVLVVQHMPPTFTRLLAERLGKVSGLPAREAQAGDQVCPGTILVAPGDFHMTLRRVGDQVRISLNQGPQENSCRPAVDVMFRSAASVYGAGTCAVVLTGMGHDGGRGCEAVHAAGGRCVVQDESTSVVWGMPAAVVNAGVADAILPLEQLAPHINALVERKDGFLKTASRG